MPTQSRPCRSLRMTLIYFWFSIALFTSLTSGVCPARKSSRLRPFQVPIHKLSPSTNRQFMRCSPGEPSIMLAALLSSIRHKPSVPASQSEPSNQAKSLVKASAGRPLTRSGMARSIPGYILRVFQLLPAIRLPSGRAYSDSMAPSGMATAPICVPGGRCFLTPDCGCSTSMPVLPVPTATLPSDKAAIENTKSSESHLPDVPAGR